MNPRVREAIEKGPQVTNKFNSYPETPSEFALRIARLCGEVAAGVCEALQVLDDTVEQHKKGAHYEPKDCAAAIRSEFDLGEKT